MLKNFVSSYLEPEMGEIMLVKFSLTLLAPIHFRSLSSLDRKSSDKIKSRTLPTSLESCSARAAFSMRPSDT